MTTNSMTQEKTIFGHPAGLYILFFVEMWERFSYYGMRAILTLFLAAPVIMGDPQSGYGWTNAETLSFYGTYTMCVYLMSIPGGWVADKFIGQKKAVMLGGLLLCLGHGILAVDAEWAFFTGLILIVVGVGFLKPNISTMVGGLYQKGDNKRDTGFYIFYMGINIGAFLGALTVGAVAAKYGWHYGFGLAGIGMAIGQLVYFYGLQYLEGVGEFIGSDKSPDKELMNKPLTKVEKDRMLVMFLSFLIIIIYLNIFDIKYIYIFFGLTLLFNNLKYVVYNNNTILNYILHILGFNPYYKNTIDYFPLKKWLWKSILGLIIAKNIDLKKIQNLIPNSFNLDKNIITKLGKNSLFIYMFHIPILYLINKL